MGCRSCVALFVIWEVCDMEDSDRHDISSGYVLPETCPSGVLEEGRIRYPRGSTVAKYVDLLSDTGFKLVFGVESNKCILIEFLNALIPEHTILDLEYLDKEKHGDLFDERVCVFDVYCRTDSGARIIVEVQKRSHDRYVERTLYYSTYPVREQVLSGSPDYSICPVYVISILQGFLRGVDTGTSVRSRFRLYDDSAGVLLTDKYNLIFIELGKFAKGLDDLDGSVLDGFYYCLKNMSNLLDRPVSLQQIIFSRLFDAARVARMTKSEHHKYNRNMITKRDIYCIAQTERRIGREEGLEEGLEEGMASGIAKIVRAMKEHGLPVELIAGISGLTETQIHDMG